MTPATTEPDTRLSRRLDLRDTVVIGLGSMIGAGVFAAIGPAARVAGSGLLVGLAMAAFVAYTLVVHVLVAIRALAAVGPAALADSHMPLATAVRARHLDALAPVVRVGGAIAALGVLLSLIAGVSRTVFAMAADGELPRWLDAVHLTLKVPHRADLVIGALVTLLVCLTDLRHAIGGCVTLACTLPARRALSGAGVLAIGAVIWATRHGGSRS